MATGWLRGVVVEVPSGDQVVVAGGSGGPGAPQKRLTLSSLVAPRLGKRDGSTRDEPFAWESREFLRKKLIGQPVVFKIDYVVEALGNREFGSVFLEAGKENVALSSVAAGMAKVRQGGSQSSPYLEDLKKAEEHAQAGNVGLWNKDPAAVAGAVRGTQGADFDAQSFLSTTGKGRPVAAIVEAVLNGGTLRVTLLPELVPATIALAGVQCPSMGKRPPAAQAEGEAPAPVEPQPEPGAREAKAFSETRVLNREVRVVLEGVDKYHNLFASVHYPAGDKVANLAEDLANAGLAKAVEWSLAMMTTGAMKLREAERAAKQAQRGMWRGYVPQNTGQTRLSNSFQGRVVEVVSGDCLMIKDLAAGVERRVNLSSIRAPRPAVRDRPSETCGNEAKEFLRKRLIGKEVTVKMEYTRKVGPQPAEGAPAPAAGEVREMAFGNVELNAAPDDQKNAAEMVVARGFATVIRHRSDEERSSVYEKLMELEELAKQAKRGVHSQKEVQPTRPNDVSLPGNAARAKAFLPAFQRSGKTQAIVDYVLSGQRLKVYVPSQNVSIAFAPSGVRAPQRAMPKSERGPATAGEPYADEALAFTREHFMQREVEIEVETVDKGGTFLGTLTLVGPKPVNLGLALLRAGLGKLQPYFAADRVKGGSELVAAEAAAREQRLKVWENWTPEQEEPGEEGEDAAAAGGSGGAGGPAETLSVVVTEVAGEDAIFLQNTAEPRVNWVAEQLAAMSLDGTAAAGVQVGSQVLAKFSLDNQWYRAYVERVHPSEPRFEVFFLDFGNKERVPSERLRNMPADLAAVPPQAKLAQLAYVKLPPLDSEWGGEALDTLAGLLGGGKRMKASVVGRERPLVRDRHPKNAQPKLLVVLTPEGAEHSVNAELLLAGMARLPKLRKVRNPAEREAIVALQQYEDEARKRHEGMWAYGDPGDSDDEAELARERGTGGGRGRGR